MRFDGCERRAQLMRRISGKAALAIKKQGDTAKQLVKCFKQRPDFIGRGTNAEWLHVIGAASLHGGGDVLQRAQSPSYRQPDQTCKKRNRNPQRMQDMNGHEVGEFSFYILAQRHLDTSPRTVRCTEHAPHLTIIGCIAKPWLPTARWKIR